MALSDTGPPGRQPSLMERGEGTVKQEMNPQDHQGGGRSSVQSFRQCDWLPPRPPARGEPGGGDENCAMRVISMHRRVRVWWAPWRQRRACRIRRFPYQDTAQQASRPGSARYERLSKGDAGRPGWDGPTGVYGLAPLMTPGQARRAGGRS